MANQFKVDDFLSNSDGRPFRKCDHPECLRDVDKGLSLNNHKSSFRFMKKDERMCYECYTKLCIHKYMDEKWKELNEKMVSGG